MRTKAVVLLVVGFAVSGLVSAHAAEPPKPAPAEKPKASSDAKPPAPPAASPPATPAPAKPAAPAPTPPAQPKPPAAPPAPPAIKFVALQVEPAKFVLSGKWSSQSLLVTAQLSDGTVRDFTSAAEFKSANPAIADVGKDGVVRPMGDGDVPITVAAKLGDATASAQVVASIKEAKNESAYFLRDVMPMFTRLGCNVAQCHGSTLGKGGFRLSMFGADPDVDYDALTKVHMGRRVNRVEPIKSLLLLKTTNAVAHTGGQKIQPNSPEHVMLASWVAQGVPWGDDKLHKPVSVKLFPKDRILPKGEGQQLLARAVYADGSERDVTRMASFATSDPTVAAIDPTGKTKAEGFGESVVSVTFLRRSDTARILTPQPLPTPFPKIDPNNKIDELVVAKLQKLGFPPSELCSDEVFLRRASLDVIGSLPTPEEARAFLADPDPKKRSKLIDRLLEREEYADFWALKWGDLLRIKSEYPVRVWPRGVLAYHRWVRGSIAANKPYDQFVRELITANGSDFLVGQANYYRAVQKREPQTYAEATAVLFMGARLDCARCHGHPTENWSQDDGMGMAAIFSKVAIKATQEWKEEVVFFNQHGGVYHPKMREYVNPKFLGAEVLDIPRDQDPRPKFADWLTSPQNPLFAKAMANRVWYWLLGRGIVHEADDFRSTNPPSNPELLDYLTQEFVGHKFDVKHLFRLILNSKTYQLSSKANDLNRNDVAHFSHYYLRRMGAEQLLDAVCQVTGTSDQFVSHIPVPPTIMPIGSRAAQVFDGDIKNPLLDLFGRPLRDTPYECERKLGGSVRQSLHLVNSDHFEGKVSGSPSLQRLLGANKPDPEMIDELYLATLSRLPRPDEKQKILDYISGVGRTVPPHLEVEKKTAEEALAKVRAGLQQANAAYEGAEKTAKDAEAAAAAAVAAATQATTAQTNAEKTAAAKRQEATDAKKKADDLVTSQQQPAKTKLAQLVQALTEVATAKAAADKALADATAVVPPAQQAAEAAEKAAQEAAAKAKAIAEDAKKSAAEKKQAADEAAAKRKAADDAKNALSQTQQKQQQAQTAANAAAEKLTQAEAQKKAAAEAVAKIDPQVTAAAQAHEAAEKAAKEAETVAAQAKAAADSARTAQATAAATEKRKLAGDAKAARDKVDGEEKVEAATTAEATKKLADAIAALKPPPNLEVDKKTAEDVLAKVRAQLQQTNAAYEPAEKAAKDAEAAVAAAAVAATQAATAQTNAEKTAPAKRQEANEAKIKLADLVAGQQQPAKTNLAQLVQVLTEAANAKAIADKALADATAVVPPAQQAAEAAEKAAQEAAAKAKAISEDAKKSAEEKKKAADEAADKRKAADDAKNAFSQAQQKPQQAQAGAKAAAEKLTGAEAQKKAAEEALAKLDQQVSASAQACQAVDKAAKDAETAAVQTKATADIARAAQPVAATAATQKRKLATDAKAARDKVDGDEKAAAAKAAEAAKKLAEATAALKPPKNQAFQDLLWALFNTKEFLFNH